MAEGGAVAVSANSAVVAKAPAVAGVAEAKVVEYAEGADTDYTITAPLAGEIIPLEQVKDESFAKGMLGPGAAIIPAGGAVVAPFDGTVTVAFETGHAYGLKSASGMQVLIHIGMDTVKLEGKCFTPRVAKGDMVRRGDVLAEVDWDGIRAAGYDTITPVVVTNKKKFDSVELSGTGTVSANDTFLETQPKEVTA